MTFLDTRRTAKSYEEKLDAKPANTNTVTDVDEVLMSIRTAVLIGEDGGFTQFVVKNHDIFGTDFFDAVQEAKNVAAIATNPNVIVIFLSDGLGNTAASLLPDANIDVIHTFAVGSGSSCTANLSEISDLTGGTCTEVSDPGDLPDILPELIGSELVSLEIEVDGLGKTTIPNSEITPDLPQDGPAMVSYETTVMDLGAGTHEICVTANGTDVGGAGSVEECIEVELNTQPVCSATPSEDLLWPPNHKMKSITIEGVTDPDGDPVTVMITSIFQDEPTNGLGDGNKSPDGDGVGTDTAELRAERSGLENGRVYYVSFTAADDNGGTCEGAVQVGVVHDQSVDGPIGDGPIFDSTIP